MINIIEAILCSLEGFKVVLCKNIKAAPIISNSANNKSYKDNICTGTRVYEKDKN